MSADLVASPHFRWMPGMQHCDEFGQTALCVEVSDGVPTRWYVDGDACDDEADDEAPVPDMSHAPTRGCLLHLVREALGGVVSLETLWSGSLGRWVYHVKLADADPHHRYVASGATPAEALTAAILAAPPKGGE